MKLHSVRSRSLFCLLIALATMVGTVSTVRAGLNLDFELVNSTGYTIKAIYIAPSSQDEWEPTDKNVLPRSLKDGESVEISFEPEAAAAKWDLKIVWADGGDSVEWLGFNLSEISKISLLYNEKTEETTAETE